MFPSTALEGEDAPVQRNLSIGGPGDGLTPLLSVGLCDQSSDRCAMLTMIILTMMCQAETHSWALVWPVLLAWIVGWMAVNVAMNHQRSRSSSNSNRPTRDAMQLVELLFRSR